MGKHPGEDRRPGLEQPAGLRVCMSEDRQVVRKAAWGGLLFMPQPGSGGGRGLGGRQRPVGQRLEASQQWLSQLSGHSEVRRLAAGAANTHLAQLCRLSPRAVWAGLSRFVWPVDTALAPQDFPLCTRPGAPEHPPFLLL